MRKQVLLFGLAGGILVTLLQWTEFHFVILEHSVALYSVLIAILFAATGLWLGTKLLAPPNPSPNPSLDHSPSHTLDETPNPTNAAIPADPPARQRLGITRRELEILHLVARGLSNREIGQTLFVSENTVKTHCSRVFNKLSARRRTEAVQRSKELGLLPEIRHPFS